MVKWKHLASAPCRHQRLPASVLWPTRLPLAEEDTSACGKAEEFRGYKLGGRPHAPIHCLVDAWPTPREEQHSFQHRTLLVVNLRHRSEQLR